MTTEKSNRIEAHHIHNDGQSKSILKKVVSSGYWLFLGNILNRALGFIRTIVLARLLSPSDFGLFGVAMLVLGTLDRFTKTGVEEALIQKKDNIEKYLNTGWTVNVVRSSVLFGTIFILAPYAAQFFRNVQAEPIIKAISLIVILNGLYNVGIIYFQKELSFKKVFIQRFLGNVADFVVAIPMALIFRNVWALVIGTITLF